MNKGRCLGLIGGLGVGATIHYYKTLARAHEEQGRTLDLVIAHAETSRVFDYVQTGDGYGLAEYLNGFLRRLKAAGAEIAAIPAVTAHFCIQQLAVTSPLPVLDIFDPLTQELAAREARKVAIFGTRFVMDTALFGFVKDVEIIHPQPDEVAYIHNTYVELAQQGKATEEQYKGLTALALTLCRREQLDAIILAGTDLALLFNDTNTAFPNIDCAALHLQAITKALLGETPLPSR